MTVGSVIEQAGEAEDHLELGGVEIWNEVIVRSARVPAVLGQLRPVDVKIVVAMDEPWSREGNVIVLSSKE